MHVIQFIHPGKEFPVSETNSAILPDGRYEVGWNTEKHHRRLVKHIGSYVDNDGVLCRNFDLVFWTEWEGPTVATRLDVARDELHARYVHEVQYPTVPEGMDDVRRECDDNLDDNCEDGLLNTDPCVFGDTFKYSNCQQSKEGVLRWLENGSLIIFVSRIQGEYYLDTVFVTKSGLEYETDSVDTINCSQQYRKLTLDRLPTGRSYTFYRCQEFTDNNQIFSFVPAKTLTGDEADYVRCRLDITAINNVAGCHAFGAELKQKFKCTIASVNLNQSIWSEIVRQIRNQGFVLGVHFDWPRWSCDVRSK